MSLISLPSLGHSSDASLSKLSFNSHTVSQCHMGPSFNAARSHGGCKLIFWNKNKIISCDHFLSTISIFWDRDQLVYEPDSPFWAFICFETSTYLGIEMRMGAQRMMARPSPSCSREPPLVWRPAGFSPVKHIELQIWNKNEKSKFDWSWLKLVRRPAKNILQENCQLQYCTVLYCSVG